MKECVSNTVICFGDSNTYGYDSRSFFGDRYSKEKRWTGILDKDTTLKIINRGMNGREIPHLTGQYELFTDQMKQWAREEGSVELWIMLGTNDLLVNAGFKAEDVGMRMRNFIKIILAESDSLEKQFLVRLIAPPLLEYGQWVQEERLYLESRRIAEIYSGIAKEMNVNFVNAAVWNIPLLYDGVHFTKEGHKNFAKEMKESLRKING